jgi:hypothetical protein
MQTKNLATLYIYTKSYRLGGLFYDPLGGTAQRKSLMLRIKAFSL